MTGSFPNHIDVDNDCEILTLARENPLLKIEVSSTGRILFSPLTGTGTGPKENEACAQLTAFARSAGGKVFSPSTGFRLPDNSLLGPDAAWVSLERLTALADEDRRSAFWRLVPDIVIEVMSEWDAWPKLLRKLPKYRKNGVGYAVAVDCENRTVEQQGNPPHGLTFDFERIFDA